MCVASADQPTLLTSNAGIDAGKAVYYRVGDPRYGWSDIRNFTAMPDTFPYAITVIADSGA
jgi:hypothetical protein